MIESATEDLSSSSTSSTSSRGQHYTRYYRKPSRNNRATPGAVTSGLGGVQLRKSHVVGSMASLIMANNNNNNNNVNNNNNHMKPGMPPRRPSSLHIPVSATRSASAAMVSPILSAASRAIHQFSAIGAKQSFEAAMPVPVGVPTSTPGASVSVNPSFPPPLIVPSAEFSPARHLTRQGRSSSSSSIQLHSNLQLNGGPPSRPVLTKGPFLDSEITIDLNLSHTVGTGSALVKASLSATSGFWMMLPNLVLWIFSVIAYDKSVNKSRIGNNSTMLNFSRYLTLTLC